GGAAELDVAWQPVADGARAGGDADRRERGPGRATAVEADESDQERHDDDSAAHPEERAEDTGDEGEREQNQHTSYRMAVGSDALLDELVENPAEAAIMLDVDGTLAPIVAPPARARVPGETR